MSKNEKNDSPNPSVKLDESVEFEVHNPPNTDPSSTKNQA